MAFSKYNRGRPFLVITRISSPSKDQKTETKKWKETAKWKIDEEILIVDRVQQKHLTQATVIIDILKRKLIKSRYSTLDDENVIKHYLSTYKEQIADGIEIWMKKKSKSKEETKKLIDAIQDELNQIPIEISTD